MKSIEDSLRDYYDEEVYQRATRPLVPEREERREAFIAECHKRGFESVLEVGCGAGRDGIGLVTAGLGYSGVDLSPKAAEMCRGLGLDAHEAQASSLPFGDGTFDAAWSMSTLMHLPAGGMVTALAELRRVIRPGGLVEIGVWGDTTDREVTGFSGRYFYLRTDETLQALLRQIGSVEDFATWDWRDDYFDGGGHYQWARVSLSR